jgi:hypothetical protein
VPKTAKHNSLYVSYVGYKVTVTNNDNFTMETHDCSDYRVSYRCSCCITLEPNEDRESEYVSLGSILVRRDSIAPTSSKKYNNPLLSK